MLQQPTGTWTNGFGYDSAHRLATVTFSAGIFTYTYKGPGTLVTNLALPNTAKITNAYEKGSRRTTYWYIAAYLRMPPWVTWRNVCVSDE